MLRSLLHASLRKAPVLARGPGAIPQTLPAFGNVAAASIRKCSLLVSLRSFTSTPLRRQLDTPERPEDAATNASHTTPTFVPRQQFSLPTTTPSWYAGHMARAIRSMPYLLARYPPPLVIEARDARLPLTSINPVFEKLLKKAPTANDGLDELSPTSAPSHSGGADASTWRSRRLIVYLKRDLIDPSLESSILTAMRERDPYQHILFVDTRVDADVKKVLHWVQRQARKIASDDSVNSPPKQISEKAEKRAKKGLSGAFRHTPTPEEGVRLLILGMPNVGKSSLLNGLRRVGTGKGKAASTAPHPGHTRKLTGTVRISKAGPSKPEGEIFTPGRRARRTQPAMQDDEAEALSGDGESFMITASDSEDVSTTAAQEETEEKTMKPKDPPIYVYDTPGVMVPFLGHGASGAERGIKLAITAGIKDSLFDVQLLADYLLFRLNLRPPSSSSSSSSSLPSYVRNLPLSQQDYLATCDDAQGRTNSISELLWHVAGKAPGSLRKGNVRDLDAAATFMLQHWRLGKLDGNTELDLNTSDPKEVARQVDAFFESGGDVGAIMGVEAGPMVVGGGGGVEGHEGESKTQAKKLQKKQDVLARKKKLMDKGVAVGKSKGKASFKGAKKKKRK
ncbi:uncharacterized protein UTRI_00885_B [Ustilago trichophora]|uniref:G domain-containing protein n=1 Tax=Ustilago trichophora TaxID=86804 RepID=A0A5C3DQH7_9BASI|nr:uncharacterized protein UTRI_00885_B [Ustilago trichophora]